MTYYEKYHCINCPVDKFCGTVVSATRLCHSLDDDGATPVLTLSKDTIDLMEQDYIYEQLSKYESIYEQED